MSWIVVGTSVALWGADKLIGGAGAASSEEIQAQRDAAGDIYQGKLDLAAGDLDLLGQTQELTKKQTEKDFLVGTKTAGAQTSDVYDKTMEASAFASKKSGFATNTEITSGAETATDELLGKYKASITDLTKSREFGDTQADLAYGRGKQGVERSKIQAEQEYQSLLGDIEAQPEGFWEGMWS